MASAWFGPCPECAQSLSYLEGVTGSKMKPSCPACGAVIIVTRPTFLMVDRSRQPPARTKA